MDARTAARRLGRILAVLGLVGTQAALAQPFIPLLVSRPPAETARVGTVPDVPLPPPRPEEDGPHLPILMPRPAAHPASEVFGPVLPSAPPAPPAPPEPDPVCGRLMTEGKVVAHPSPAVSDGKGCGIANPVTLDAVVLRDGRRVPLFPPALMRCDLADRFADWLRDGVAPATAAEGPLLGVADAAAYVCRNRNWMASARISEHARGNAIDVLAFRFGRRVVGLTSTDAHDVMTAARASACARFSTVLGPGSDAFHATDLHLDLEHRRNDFRLCQWDVP